MSLGQDFQLCLDGAIETATLLPAKNVFNQHFVILFSVGEKKLVGSNEFLKFLLGSWASFSVTTTPTSTTPKRQGKYSEG